MEMSKSEIRTIAERYEIKVSNILKDNPERVFAFLYGYLTLSGLPGSFNLTSKMRESLKDRPDLKTAVDLGYVTGHPRIYKQTVEDAYRFGVKGDNGGERTLDAVELHNKMARNPSFIPNEYWPNHEEVE